MGPRHHLSFCACNTACLSPELLVSMGPHLYLWFLHAKQRLLEQNYKYLCVPPLICDFWFVTSTALLCNQNGVICTRISSLYWFQPLSVVLCLQNSDFRTRLTSLYGSQTSSVVLSTHNCVLNTRIWRQYVFQPLPVVLCMQKSDFSTWIASFYWSQPSSMFFACKTATFGPE